uniref:Uncharacterized protein n=1 Tax=Oryza glumipatula TaxID=40148 RepID=A0A0E0AYZ0_9ORYZ
MAGAAGAGAEEVPGEAVGDVIHLLLRRHPVPHHRRLHGEGRRRLGLPLRLRALHHPLRRIHRVGGGVRGADMVHRQGGPGVRGGVSARPDPGGGHHGLPHPRRELLPRRHHRRRLHHRRPLPRPLGQEPRACSPRQGRRRHCHRPRRRPLPDHRRRQAVLLRHPAPPAAYLLLLRQPRLIDQSVSLLITCVHASSHLIDRLAASTTDLAC